MDEYISRRELLARYDAEHEGTPGRARELIKQAPAADVAPVVYCKDCYYLAYSDFYGECSRGLLGVVRPMDYCSRGARRNKEGKHETD